MMSISVEELIYPAVTIRFLALYLEFKASKARNWDNFDRQELRINAIFFFLNKIIPPFLVGYVAWWAALIRPFQFRPFDLGLFWNFVVTFLAAEFVYYWTHRFGHSVRWAWATHAVHHSPKYLNMSSSLREGRLTGPFSFYFVFSLPLYWLGFPPGLVTLCLFLSGEYQWFVHTEYFPRNKWLDFLFNTPSNHRVHHANHPAYINKNFGAILMVYDRIFGTYAPEDQSIKNVYGNHEDLGSGSAIAVALCGWRSLFRDFIRYPSPKIWIQLIVRHPRWKPKAQSNS